MVNQIDITTLNRKTPPKGPNCRSNFRQRRISSNFVSKPILICLIIFIAIRAFQLNSVQALWLFQQQQQTESASSNKSITEQLSSLVSQQMSQQIEQVQQEKSAQPVAVQAQPQTTGSASGNTGYGYYGSGLLSMAGLQSASLSTLLNTVGDTGFRYFNIQDQCRNRAACDLGAMLHKKLSFIHNWIIRATVRSLTDINNVYMQSWMEGMLGRNCTAVYISCRQSPLEGLMNLAVLQQLVY